LNRAQKTVVVDLVSSLGTLVFAYYASANGLGFLGEVVFWTGVFVIVKAHLQRWRDTPNGNGNASATPAQQAADVGEAIAEGVADALPTGPVTDAVKAALAGAGAPETTPE
jgi:hypothetical protein